MLDVLTMTARFPRRSGRGEFIGTGDALMAPMSGRIRDAEEALRRAARRSGRSVDDAALSDAAELALDSPVVTQAVALSRWIAEWGPRPLTPRQVLRKPDIPVAAAVMAPPENPRTAADVPALNRRWNLALDTGLLRADGGTVTAGPALATWPPGDPDILAAWLDGLLTVSGSETGSPWDDTPATDILVFLTAVQEAADGVPLRDQLIKQAAELAERVGLDATFFWPEKGSRRPVMRTPCGY